MKGKSRTASAFPFSLHGIMNNAAAARSESPRMAAAGRELLTRTLAAVSGNGGLIPEQISPAEPRYDDPCRRRIYGTVSDVGFGNIYGYELNNSTGCDNI